MLAHQLISRDGIKPISYWLTQSSSRQQSIMRVSTSLTTLSSSLGTNSCSFPERVRLLLPRQVKRTPIPDSIIPLPPGRIIVPVATSDDAQTHTYASISTLNDAGKGIDAGVGLFARRLHGPSSKLDDGHLVGYYLGTNLTRSELDELHRNPQGRMLGFILEFQGMIVDGYDHLRDRYHSMPVLMNDFCDDYGNNTEAVIETITLNNKRIDVIAIHVNKDVQAHEEFGYAYGHSGLCDASLPLPVLFKASRYYYKQIMKDEKRI